VYINTECQGLINPCVQVEDVRLRLRKVLYHFAIFVIVNEILIFEDCRKEAYSAGPSSNANGWQDTPRVSKRALFTAAMATLAMHERRGVVHVFSYSKKII